MSLYLNRPKIFGNTANSGSKLLYSCIQQTYIVHIESGGTSVFILLLAKTSFFPLRVQKAEVSATLELGGTEHISTRQWGWRGRVSQCHNGIKCSEFMLRDGEDCQMHKSAPHCTFSSRCHSVHDGTHRAMALDLHFTSANCLLQQLHGLGNGPLILNRSNNQQNPLELFIMKFL